MAEAVSTPTEVALAALHEAEAALEAAKAAEAPASAPVSAPPAGGTTSLMLGHIGEPPVQGHDY
jgi:hypothetical protein